MAEAITENKAITFTLNGRVVHAAPGETVLSVARREGIAIPALCHHAAVTAYGACRLCLVEAFWGKRSKLVTSCIYTPWENEVIETDSERVRRARRTVIEMLLARCPGVELLRDLAREYSVETLRFPVSAEAANERCILCGLCVRVCAEQIGQTALGYGYRGSERVVTTAFSEQANECIGCAACVQVCPTAALHYEDTDGMRIFPELHTAMPLVACRVCGDYFATEKQLEKIRERFAVPEHLTEVCPRCRGTEFTRVLDDALVTKSRV